MFKTIEEIKIDLKETNRIVITNALNVVSLINKGAKIPVTTIQCSIDFRDRFGLFSVGGIMIDIPTDTFDYSVIVDDLVEFYANSNKVFRLVDFNTTTYRVVNGTNGNIYNSCSVKFIDDSCIPKVPSYRY